MPKPPSPGKQPPPDNRSRTATSTTRRRPRARQGRPALRPARRHGHDEKTSRSGSRFQAKIVECVLPVPQSVSGIGGCSHVALRASRFCDAFAAVSLQDAPITRRQLVCSTPHYLPGAQRSASPENSQYRPDALGHSNIRHQRHRRATSDRIDVLEVAPTASWPVRRDHHNHHDQRRDDHAEHRRGAMVVQHRDQDERQQATAQAGQ